MTIHLRAVLLAGLALPLAGCASVSTFNTGKTLEQNQLQIGGGIGGGKIKTKSRIVDFDADIANIALELWMRYGFTNFLEAGVKLAIPGFAMGELRGGLLNEDRGAPLSMAVGVGYGGVKADNEATFSSFDAEDHTKLRDLSTTLYVSKEVTDVVQVYASPRHIRRKTENRRVVSGRPDQLEKFDDTMVGGGLGVAFDFDKIMRILIEYNLVVDTNQSSHRQTFTGVGFDLRFGGQSRKKRKQASHP